MRKLLLLLTFAAACCQMSSVGNGAFSFEDDGNRLIVSENGKPVFAYQYNRVDPPEGIDPALSRSNYLHPVFGIDGEILTEDFPKDHPHHRGIYWAWPVVSARGQTGSPWALTGMRQLFQEWIQQEATADKAELKFRGTWLLDDDEEPFVSEEISIRVHPAETDHRTIDFTIRLENIDQNPVAIGGSPTSGYGGFNIRPIGSRSGKTITTASGKLERDSLEDDSPWADFSSIVSQNGEMAGIALFQHPKNPGYPHPGWILRHYGFLGHAWPHYEPHTLAPGKTVTLRYRVLIHRGNAETARIADHFKEFKQAAN